MPTLTVEDLPPQLYETLARRASEAQRTVSDEVKQILADTLGGPAEATHDFRLPELIPSQEISPPCDLPRPGENERVSCKDGGVRLPDPFTALVEDHAQ